MKNSVQANSPTCIVAENLRKQGYSVTVEPDPSVIPFDLQRYRPDILATRGDENLIVDVKTRDSYRSIERYRELSETINGHANWRFMLSTFNDIDPSTYSPVDKHPDPASLNRMLSKIESLLSGENYDLAVPYVWLVYVSAMRIVGEGADIPMDATSDRSVLDYMYSLGELSFDEYDSAKKFLDIRNKAVHHLEVDVSKETVLEMYEYTRQKLHEWELN